MEKNLDKKTKKSHLTAFILPVIVFSLSFTIYLNNLENSFHYDDKHNIKENPYISSLSNVPRFFLDSKTFTKKEVKGMYRPLLMTTYAINYRIGKLNVSGFHLANNSIHALNALFIYLISLLLLKIEGDNKITSVNKTTKVNTEWYAFAAGLVFGLHTINTQAVNYISSRSVLLVTLFYLISFYLFLKAREETDLKDKNIKRFALYYILSLISYSFSLLSKEIAITLPIVLLLYEYIILIRKRKDKSRDTKTTTQKSFIKALNPALWIIYLKYHIFFWITSGGYLLLRKKIIGQAAIKITYNTMITGKGSHRSILENFLIQTKAILLYIKLFFMPVGLSVLHDISKVKGLTEPYVLMSAAFIVLILISAIMLRKRYSSISFCILWFFITILPETIIPLNIIVNEHRTYLPCIGFSLLTAFLLYNTEKTNQKRLIKTALSIVIIVFISLNARATIKRNKIWKNEYTLWSDTVKKAPKSFIAHDSLGSAYIARKQFNKAVAQFKTAIDLNPKYVKSYNNLGIAYLKMKHIDSAIMAFKTAIKLNPSYPMPYFNLGLSYTQKGMIDKSIDAYLEALQFTVISSDKADILNNLGNAFSRKGNWQEAIKSYRKALKFQPYNKATLHNLDNALKKIKQP